MSSRACLIEGICDFDARKRACVANDESCAGSHNCKRLGKCGYDKKHAECAPLEDARRHDHAHDRQSTRDDDAAVQGGVHGLHQLKVWLLQTGEPAPLDENVRRMRTGVLAEELAARYPQRDPWPDLRPPDTAAPPGWHERQQEMVAAYRDKSGRDDAEIEALSEVTKQRAESLWVVDQEVALLRGAGHRVEVFERRSDDIAARSLPSKAALPLLVPWNVVGTIWQMFARPDIGLLGASVNQLGIDFNFTADPRDAWIVLLLMDVWHWTPLVALLCYAGLRSIPDAYSQAARTRWVVTAPRYTRGVQAGSV